MRTLFDLVGKFGVVTREAEGQPGHFGYKYITLHADMSPNQVAAGKSSLRLHAVRRSSPFIKTTGLTRQWLEDWDLVERHLPNEVEPEASQAKAA